MATRKLLLQTKQLVVDYEERGMSALQLSKRERCSINTVLQRLREAGVIIRPAGERHTTKELKLSRQERAKFLEIVDGLLLGDGSINVAGALQVNQTLTHAPWLEQISALCTEVRLKNGITPTRKRKASRIRGRLIQGKSVRTFYAHTYEETKAQRLRWYPKGTKCVPEDIVLTPLSVALWYCGDGTGAPNGTMWFSTCDFTESEVQRLARSLSETFCVQATACRSKDGPLLALYRRDDCVRLLASIRKHIPECFHYKFKHIRAAIPRGRALRRLTPSQVQRIRVLEASGISARELGRQYGVSNVSILNLVSRRTYQDVE